MTRRTTRQKSIDEPPQIVAEVLINEEKVMLREPAPEGFPRKLFPYLADYMRRGFIAALSRRSSPDVQDFEEIDLAPYAAPLSGRPVNPEVQELGRNAARLRRGGLTYGQIARQLCPLKNAQGHHCGRRCADRIRQAAKPYLKRR